MIYDTDDWVHIEDDDLNEQFTSWYIDKKHKKIISVANLNKEQEEIYGEVFE